ncbi:MAG: glycoside hydrolase family 43 protein [Bacteroidaceae bacterium]
MKKLITLVCLSLLKITPFTVFAQNPIIQTKYTADPAPMVYNDTLYLYTSHDEDNANGFLMKDWLLYTTTDMVNWKDHGVVASLENFNWVKHDNGAWAVQCIYRNGKFYLYCPIHGQGIGVLMADSPYGPFHDPLGKKLIKDDHVWNDIDPTPFIDDDGQAYLYFGNPDVYHVKLNEDMISYSGEVKKQSIHPYLYQEGPWMFKHKGRYYLAFASTCCPEGIGYAMAENPEGPWITAGEIMPRTEKSRGNHPGIVDYKGHTYVFGLNYDIMHYDTYEHHERRSVSVAEMEYNPDGTIKMIPYWPKEGVKQLEPLNPYNRVEAETMAWGLGVKTEKFKNGGLYVTKIDDGDSIIVRGADFGYSGAKKFTANIMPFNNEGGNIEIHLDSSHGLLVGILKVKPNSDKKYKEISCPVKGAMGVHDIFFIFHGNEKKDLFDFDYWKFDSREKNHSKEKI